MQPAEPSVQVVLDATPLLGNETGVAVFTRSLMEALLPRHDIELAAFGLTGRNVGALTSTLPPRTPHNTAPMPAAVLTHLWKYSNVPPLDAWMKVSGVVHGTNFIVPPARNAARLVTVHDLTAIRYPELCTSASLRYPKLVASAVRRGAHVHTLSRSVASDVEELLGVPPNRIHVIAPGIQAHSTIELPAVTPPAPYVFAIGTVEPRKDYPTLIRAFDILASSLPEVQLLIAGERAWGANAFDSALAGAHHADRIRVLGRISEEQYDAYLRQASVLAYPSIYEGFGYPPLEAMRAGVPVVATNVASLPEVCEDAALLVEPRNPDALASALERVLTDTSLRDQLINRGSTRVAMFQWEDAASKFVHLYKELAT